MISHNPPESLPFQNGGQNKKLGMEVGSECVFYGPSTQNKIERWWKELLKRMERFFNIQLSTLVEDGGYDASDDYDR